MTQKRFRKLLMSEGISKNDVNSMIEENKKLKKPYEYKKMYNCYHAVKGISIEGLAEAVERATQAIVRLGKACQKAVEAFNNALIGGKL